MKLKVRIPEKLCKKLKDPVDQFNDWQYRTDQIELGDDSLCIELADFPVFWGQFLGEHKSLRSSVHNDFLDALRHVEFGQDSVSYKKAMEALLT